MKISIIHPSRGRPDLALKTMLIWSMGIGMTPFQYILSIDGDDPLRERYMELFKEGDYLMKQGNLKIVVRSNDNVVHAMNTGAKFADGDILVCISDDFDCPKNWGDLIKANIDPELPEALQVNDLHPDIDATKNILTLPILTKKLYEKLGYVYYPEYSGIYADDDLAQLCASQGWLRKNFELRFEHHHWSANKGKPDATNRRHDNPQGWKLGAAVLKKRQALNFGLEPPQKLLSILIPTIEGREKSLNRLTNFIVDTLKTDGYLPLVECIYNKDNKEMSLGEKRQKLYEDCTGKYAWQIDDDDSIDKNSFRKIIPALLKDPTIDCVGFLEECRVNNSHRVQIACHSNRYQMWENNKDGFDYIRTIFYKDIILTSHCRVVGFKNLRYGEDHDFAIRLKDSGLLKNEFFINSIIYYYHYSTSTPHKVKFGIK